MTIVSNTFVEAVYSTCTARFWHYIPGLLNSQGKLCFTPIQTYAFLDKTLYDKLYQSMERPLYQPPSQNPARGWEKWTEEQLETWRNGYALYFHIITESQKISGIGATLEKLGFQECFKAPKSHDDSRQKNSGALYMYCVQPWVLEERRQEWMNVLRGLIENTTKLSFEELTRRASFRQFTRYAMNKGIGPDNIAVLRMGELSRKKQCKEILEYSGYDPQTDPVIIELVQKGKPDIPWHMIERRALQWQRGEF